jgi:ElaB/YqjD/DUF883 family membrane-anchored ribosome-binding protein
MADESYTGEPLGAERMPDQPMAARTEIEMTRARMSETIDEIEDALLRKKARIQNRLDVMAPVRERPLESAAAALGAGLVLGLLTGGHDEDRYEIHDTGLDDDIDDRLEEAEERAARWESRARRLMKAARKQEAQLETMASHRERWGSEDGGPPDGISGMRDRIADGVSGFLGSVARDLFAGRGR